MSGESRTSAPDAIGTPLARHWSRLDRTRDFLNHGSFGACPDAVLDRQTELRDELERDPVRFMVTRLEPLMDEVRVSLGGFLGAEPDDLAPVPNATFGVNSVLRSLDLAPGDELLAIDHGYNACLNALRYVADRVGARVVVAPVPFPIDDPGRVVEAVLGAASARTRLALLCHVTSPTALVLPITELVRELRERGIETLVDAAHAPGMVDVDLAALGAGYCTANLHKWVCAPKGAGVLHVRRDLQPRVRPAVISHGANAARRDRSRFQLEFGWTGTDDPTAMLSVPAALATMAGMVEGGWPEVRARNRALAHRAREILCAALEVPEPAPASMLGSMASVPLPIEAPAEPAPSRYEDPMQDALVEEHGIQVPVVAWPRGGRRRLVRVSAQLYNDEAQYVRLAAALRRLCS